MDTDALSQRLFQNVTGALEMYAVYLGERLGYYRALADGGPMTSAELAAKTGTAERYTREWLEHHATAGLLEVDGDRFTLPAEHIPVLADRDSVLFDTQHGINLVRVGRRMADLVEAYRTGDAPPPIPWEPEGRAEANRPLFLNLLARQWLPSIPAIHSRLADGPARVADIACGLGWSSIAMAHSYPQLTVDGLDLDEMAISAAQEHAAAEGVADRVRFRAMDAADLAGVEKYDLVTIIEALHDMTQPVAALTAARKLLADNGSVLVIDLLTEEELTAPGSVREQQEYGWSLVACLPGAMGDPASAQTGTMMRPSKLREYALEAGFTDVTIHPVDNDKFRFYELS
jgi:2-polyprenyl-3-methyl-5-hydroxy-6-metoxy-1,4-benzoquinol methylase